MNNEIKIKQDRIGGKTYYSPQKMSKMNPKLNLKNETRIKYLLKPSSYKKSDKNNYIKFRDFRCNIIQKKNLNNINTINKRIVSIPNNQRCINKEKNFKNIKRISQISKTKPYLIKVDLTKIDKNYIINKNKKNINKEEKDFDSNNIDQNEIFSSNKNEPFKSFAFVEYPNLNCREYMEDFHDFKNLSFDKFICYYFSIFDGHNGKEVSSYLKLNFYEILLTELRKLDFSEEERINKENIILSIKKAFEKIDNDLIKDKNIKNNIGSTGTIILLYRELYNFSKINLICANIGDSKGFILNKQNIYQITEDHNCDNQIEVERVKKSGGLVFKGRVFGSLILTRSFGDKEMKQYGIISNPYIFHTLINKDDLYAIVCSDGVWDVCSKVDLLKLSLNNISSEELAKKIVKLSIEKGTNDNVSCLVIKLNINH